MAGNNGHSPIRSKAENIVETIYGVSRAFDSGFGRLQTAAYDDQQILLSQSVSTAINNIQISAIREFASDSQISELVNTMHSHKKQYLTLLTDNDEKSKISSSMEWSVAETEAKLKGFIVSSVLDSWEEKSTVSKQGKRDQIEQSEIKHREERLAQATAERDAVKTAILNLSNKNILPKDYPDKVSQEAQKLLKQSGKEFSPDVLDRCRTGGQNVGNQEFSESEKQEIANATSQLIHKLGDVLNRVDYKKVEIEVVNKLAKNVNDEAIKRLSAKGYKIDDKRREKIEVGLSGILREFDSKYLEKYSDIIAKDISEKLIDKKSWSSLLSSNYTISTKELEKIATDVKNKHFKEYLKMSTTDIDNKIVPLYSSSDPKELNKRLASNLTQFLQETHQTIEVGEKPLSHIDTEIFQKIESPQLARVRERDRQKFDELIFSSPSLKKSNTQEILNEPQLVTQQPSTMIQELSQVFNKGDIKIVEKHMATTSSSPRPLAIPKQSRTNSSSRS